MNLDDDYISWSLSEVFSPSWITWCYKFKCIGCIHHVITACTKPKIQEDKLGCYDVGGGVGWQVCADAGFFSKVYCCCWESSPLDGDFLIFTLFGFLFWTRYILSSSFFPLSFLKTFIRLKTCLPWKIKEFKNCKKTTCNLTLKDSS